MNATDKSDVSRDSNFHRVPNSLPVALLTALAEECILESPSPIETIMWKIKRLVTVCS